MSLLAIKERITSFIQENEIVLKPVSKFFFALLVLIEYNSLFQYTDTISKFAVVVLISFICAFFPMGFMCFVTGLVVVYQLIFCSVETAVVFVVLAFIFYLLYMRLSPGRAWVIMLVPILMIKLPYAVPLIVGVTVGVSGLIPSVFGVIIYFFSIHAKEVFALVSSNDDESSVQAYQYILDSIFKDKLMLVYIIAFAVVILIIAFVRSRAFHHAWYVAIGVGVITDLVITLILALVLDQNITAIAVLIGSLLGGAIAVLIQFFRCVVDYSRIEQVQFEDDDYYYYVKAVPKITVTAKKVKVKKINERKENDRTL